MKRFLLLIVSGLIAVFSAGAVLALDPPHDATKTMQCKTCHTPHKASGGAITTVGGNANLCLSCHVLGGPATGKPFVDADQGLPAPGLPSATNPSGTSHRWDSGASGHVAKVGSPVSTGTVQSGGAFTGRYAKTYIITTTGIGATFSWNCRRWPTDTDVACGSGTGNTTGTTALNEGITVTFTGSFVAGDQWRIYVRTDINQPANAAMAQRIYDGKVVCSTCHDQHSQANEPFDSAAPPYGGAGTGAGRHFQRVANNTNQMCIDCHSARNKGALSGQTNNLTHPANVSIPGTGNYKAPTTLPLDKTTSKVQCMSCHKPHYTASSDGTLTRLSNINSLCTDCHTNSDTTNGSHLKSATGVLWPGGQYGTLFPQITDATKRGFCTNCHQGHGWPDAGSPAQDYSKLLVEKHVQTSATNDTDEGEDLCYTCHDGSPAKNIMALFNKASGSRHPVKDSEQAAGTGRSVECVDCHNVHKAKSGTHTAQTNSAGPPLESVTGVEPTYSATFWAAPTGYTQRTLQAGVNPEAWLCFKCHSSYYGTLPISPSGGYQGTDTAREFNPANTGNYGGSWSSGETAGSFHPVLASAGNNLGATSNIKAPWTRTSLMTCSDCHASDNTADPNGPHGSTVGFLLKGPNTLWNATLSADNSGMPNGTFCINCHNQDFTNSRFGNNHTRNRHSSNAPGGGTIKCWNCHSAIPHGTARPGLLVTPYSGRCGRDSLPSVSPLQVTDAAPYLRLPAGNNGLCFVSYPSDNTQSWSQSNCGCGNAWDWGH